MQPINKIFIGAISIFFASSVFAAAATGAATANQSAKLPINDLERFTSVIEHINNYYVKQVDDGELFENAIRGMLAGLDPHSAYLDPADFAELKASTSGKFGGLGIEVTLEDGFIKVITPIDGTPAAKAGIKPGDLIVKIDDTPVKDINLTDAVDKMRGKPGSDVMLTIVRKGDDKPLKIKVTRAVINVQSVTAKMVDTDYGYIRISQFQNETGSEITKAINKMMSDAQSKPKGFILDLRNNPGGVLEASVQVASAFLDKDKLPYEKVVVSTKGRIPGSQMKEKATGKDLTKGLPLIVMVNDGSASASEIVAGALQDYKRAIILGTQTFGKASVQTVLPLKDQRGLKLTTALYYTPAGRSIQATGITPDLVVENVSLPKPSEEDAQSMLIHEINLDNHLETKSGKTENAKSDTSAKTATDTTLMYSDYQLYQAINALKAQQVLNK